ncbi:hypothetical protein [Lichenifustis flavocetrariae]|uniref:Uncharacterized protein n=1 Tax=Lichenifustis flavocetrariae TaxID=2949735 RepID=A0AA42CJJ1_9HYPH|nr:hypothetical protein [Lichenifustis flavocetrariae]MCW6509514.1 hypothetical protein [Lichenifustis flavocetrariae]
MTWGKESSYSHLIFQEISMRFGESRLKARDVIQKKQPPFIAALGRNVAQKNIHTSLPADLDPCGSSKRNRIAVGAACLISLFVTTGAHATVIVPAWGYSGNTQVTTSYRDGLHHPIEGDVFGGPDLNHVGETTRSTSHSTTTVDLDLSGRPKTVSSSAATAASPLGGGDAKNNAQLIYYFAIEGSENRQIPILVQASGRTNVNIGLNSLSNAYASFELDGVVNGSGQGLLRSIESHSNTDAVNLTDSFDINGYFSLETNEIYKIRMVVSTDALAGYGLDAQSTQLSSLATAVVDPFFAIDPSISGYQIVFSEGINNGSLSAVPLPSSLPMFGAAVLMIGVLGYSKRRVVPA